MPREMPFYHGEKAAPIDDRQSIDILQLHGNVRILTLPYEHIPEERTVRLLSDESVLDKRPLATCCRPHLRRSPAVTHQRHEKLTRRLTTIIMMVKLSLNSHPV